MSDLSFLDSVKVQTEAKLNEAREIARSVIGQADGLIVGVNGSFARREATSGSDLDLFYLFSGNALPVAVEAKQALNDALIKGGFKPPSKGGVFEHPLSMSILTENIGGMEDKNVTITRRMLLLLEGEWLHNQSAYDDARQRIVSAYVPDTVRPDHIALFLLNDVIRYWRTVSGT